MVKTITDYVLEESLLRYDDGNVRWEATYYFNADRKEFRIYDLSCKSLSEAEIAIVINEFLTYYYFIASYYVPKETAIEDFSFLINGYNVSKKGYDMLTYYITEIEPAVNESNSLKNVREAFKYVTSNYDKLGKEALVIQFKGNRFAFLNFYMDLIHVIDNYSDFPEDTSIVYDYKKRIINHEFYLLPSKE